MKQSNIQYRRRERDREIVQCSDDNNSECDVCGER